MNATGKPRKRDHDRTGRFAATFAWMRGRVSYAGIIASVALFVALGGTAAAVTAIPRDSVGSPQIRTDAVRAPEIAKDAVRSPEIAKDAVRSPEIAADAVRSPEIAEGCGPQLRDSRRRHPCSRTSRPAHAMRCRAPRAAGPGPAGVTELRVAQGGRRPCRSAPI